MDSSERLARVRDLLAGLPGSYGNEHLWTLIRYAEHDVDLFAQVYAFLSDCGVIDPTSRFGDAPQAPQDAAELTGLVTEVDQQAALTVLVGVASQTLAYRVPARYSADRAREVFGKLAELLGHGTRWWTSTDLSSWKPVTRHSMDALVVCTGGGLLLAVLAVDED